MSSDKTPFFKQGDPLFRYITETQGDEVYPPESPAAYKPGARHLSDVELAPMLHRSRTFCDYLKPNRDLVVPISVNNPMQANRRLSVVPGNDFDRLIERVGSLKSLRPFKLIGKMGKRVDWGSYKVDADSKLIKNSKVREFYKEQNELIECYEDIDLLLDTGVQFDMVQSYADNTSSNTSEEDSDSGLENENPIEVDVKSERLTLPITSLKMMKKSSNGTTNSSGRKHINISAVPGNIDIEGAKILGYGDHPSSNVVLYAIYFNFVLNVILLVGKIVAVYLSDSMSLIASLVDSSLDFLSTMIIFISNKYAAKQSTKFPVGRKQLEPIGVLVFSVLMILSFSQVLIESIKELVELGSPHEVTRISMTAIIIMVSTITSKIVAYLLCKSVKNSSVQALVEDAKTDIVFNIFSLLFPVLSLVLRVWWIDSLGASLLCIYVISQWAAITFEHIDHLSGSHASKKNYQQVLYMVARFSEEIEGIKNYRMYHVGDLVNVEVDIVLRNSKMSLKDCHDLGESLQYAIETLPYVNRCFVHIDYKIRNYLGHIS